MRTHASAISRWRAASDGAAAMHGAAMPAAASQQQQMLLLAVLGSSYLLMTPRPVGHATGMGTSVNIELL